MFDVITVGGATRDVFFVTSKAKIINSHDEAFLAFKYGSKIIPEDSLFTYGGGGANSAISFAKYGLSVASVMNIGAEGTGSLVVKELESAGVNCEFVSRDKVNHTALSIIVSLKGRDHTMFLYRGANDFLSVRDWRPLKTKWFYISSLTGSSGEILPELFSYARAHGIKIAWNPGSEQLEKGYYELEAYLDITDVLLLNKDEAKQLVFSKEKNPKVKSIEEIVAELYEMNHNLVVVTDSGKGSYLYDGKKLLFEPATSCTPVETTGAGDAYGSTLVGGIIKGMSLKEAMKMATINAGNVVQNVGAQKGLMTFDELRAKMKVGNL